MTDEGAGKTALTQHRYSRMPPRRGWGFYRNRFYKDSAPMELRQMPAAAADVLQQTGIAGNQGFAGFSDASQRSWRGWRSQFRMGTRVRCEPVRNVALYLCR